MYIIYRFAFVCVCAIFENRNTPNMPCHGYVFSYTQCQLFSLCFQNSRTKQNEKCKKILFWIHIQIGNMVVATYSVSFPLRLLFSSSNFPYKNEFSIFFFVYYVLEKCDSVVFFIHSQLASDGV